MQTNEQRRLVVNRGARPTAAAFRARDGPSTVPAEAVAARARLCGVSIERCAIQEFRTACRPSMKSAC